MRLFNFDNLLYWLEFNDEKESKGFLFIKRNPSTKSALREYLFSHSVLKNKDSIPLFEKLSELV
jgi:hypothetical protein